MFNGNENLYKLHSFIVDGINIEVVSAYNLD